MKYSHFCNNCGEQFSSDNRAEVDDFRKHHKIRHKENRNGTMVTLSYCPFDIVDIRGQRALMRPSLRKILELKAV